MRVAFSTNNQETIAKHIGLAKGFLIVDTNTDEKSYIENPIIKELKEKHISLKNTNEEDRGLNAGRIIPSLLKEAGVDILVSRDFGKEMIKNLQYYGIRGFETEQKNINEILNQIKEDEMNEVTKFNANENELEYGYGRGYGRGRGLGCRRESRGFGRARGFGARNERRFERGRGFGNRRGFGFRGED